MGDVCKCGKYTLRGGGPTFLKEDVMPCNECEALRAEVARLAGEVADLYAQVEILKAERDEAKAEVDRLYTACNAEEERADRAEDQQGAIQRCRELAELEVERLRGALRGLTTWLSSNRWRIRLRGDEADARAAWDELEQAHNAGCAALGKTD